MRNRLVGLALVLVLVSWPVAASPGGVAVDSWIDSVVDWINDAIDDLNDPESIDETDPPDDPEIGAGVEPNG